MTKSTLASLIISLLALFFMAPFSFNLGPVPVTMQSVIIIVMAGVLKRNLALVAIFAYLIAGAIGLPVFGGYSAGWEKLIGPTAGFLWGFILAVLFVSYEAQQKEMHLFNAMVLAFKAHFLLLVPGFLVLYFSLPGADLWATFTRLIPGLLLKSIVGGIVISQIRVYLNAKD